MAEVQKEDEAYKRMLLLDDLESLLEELEDEGITSESALPPGMRERMVELDVFSLMALRGKIAELHSEMDKEEA